MRPLQVLWAAAGFSAMVGGLLTWVIGFRVPQGYSLITSTLALMAGMGGFWLLDRRHRRWSWLLVAAVLPLGFYFNFMSPYFPTPSIFVALSLLLTGMTALLSALRRPPRPAAPEADEASSPERRRANR